MHHGGKRSDSELRTVQVANANGNGDASYRELLQQLIEGLHRENLTAMLSHGVIVHEAQAATLEIAEFLADTVIVLRQEERQLSVYRSLQIKKSRGQDYEGGRHTLRIQGASPPKPPPPGATKGDPPTALTPGDGGLQVFRRVQTPPRRYEPQPTSTARRSVIGCDPLDALIGGGIFDGSTTMVAGVSGAGKTVLGVQLLLEGARKQNKRGLYECPQELEIDARFDRIVCTIEEHKVERLLIDGMTSYSAALEDQKLYRDFFHALVAFSKQHLLTTFFNYENPELFGMTHFMPEFAVSSIVDNIILMNFVELGNTLHRAITVAKARGSDHHFVTREFKIGQGGISLMPEDEAPALPVRPFQRYYGLLSRAPTRLSPDLEERGDGSAIAGATKGG